MTKTDAGAPYTTPSLSEEIDPAHQQRNIMVFSALTALIYLAAPILYVGFVQAAICKRLMTSDTVANLPSTVFLAMAWCPMIIAWLFPEARKLKVILKSCFGLVSVTSAVVAVLLLAGVSRDVVVATLVVHAAVLGAANGIIFTLNWEALTRGVSDRKRGRALGLAFGWGPGFAVFGSLCTQILLEGKVLGWKSPAWLSASYPLNYALLFAGTALAMGLAALLAHFYRIPAPAKEAAPVGFGDAVLGGFRNIARNRILLLACIAYLLVISCNTIQNNMSIFTLEAVGRHAEDLAGYQLTLRFSFKMAAGFFLGWLLTRTNPKVPMLITVLVQIVAVIWVLAVPGYWFLLAFGLNGAAELCGVYYVNYAVQCSRKSEVRGNIAFLMVASSVTALAPMFFGRISDYWGLRASFYSAVALLIFTTVMVWLKLPARPQRSDSVS